MPDPAQTEELEVQEENPGVQEGAEETGTEQETKTETPQGDDPAAAIQALKAQIAEYEARSKNTQAELEAARRAREEERRGREEAERLAGTARDEVTNTMRAAEDARYDAIVNALAAARSQLDHQKGAYKKAIADGDADAAADIAAEMALIGARVNTFEAGKAEIEARAKEQPRQPQAPQESPLQQRERWMNSLNPRVADWIRNHYDRYWGDDQFRELAARGHHAALGMGYREGSDDYLRAVEESTGLRQRADTAPAATEAARPMPTSAAATTAPRRSPSPAAPAAGSTPNGTRSTASASQVTLTAEERDFCRINEIPEANYAKNKADMIREGLISSGRLN